jgi:hypothetical protein
MKCYEEVQKWMKFKCNPMRWRGVSCSWITPFLFSYLPTIRSLQEQVCYKGPHALEVSKLRAFGYVAMRSDSFEFGVVGVRWDENVENR